MLRCPMYGPNARSPLKGVEFMFDSLERILEGFDSVFVNIENYQNTMEAVKTFLGGALEEYETEFPSDDKERERREGLWREMTRLQIYFEQKNRILLRYAGPSFDPSSDPTKAFPMAANPLSPELFLRLWKSPWCQQVQFLAILIGDYALENVWRETDLSRKARALWPNEPGIFEQTKLRQIMLVVRPPGYMRERIGLESSLSRNMYGFARYEFCSRFFTDEHREVLGRQFRLYENQLRSMFPENSRIRINHEIDIDCRSIGLDQDETPTYSRTERPVPHNPRMRASAPSPEGRERAEN
ncbi:hypothetical protein EKO27_g10837 [Xylaria grammica]|uniref:Uncharacterized protein n=1 Tax=Xylaria grammica TaxID=363999 RepID=A0A439CQ22_9PEZI|nr:hypothetical protein EKO27_g10837 [Xylaria grammica]